MRRAWVRLGIGLVSVVLVLCLVVKGYDEWQKTINATAVCPFYAQDWQQHQRYIQLYIDAERLRDPIFDGRYFINLGSDFGRPPYILRMTQSGSGAYMPTDFVPVFIWNANFQNLMMLNNKEEMAFVSHGRPHFMFPFDYGDFHETLTFEPQIDIKAVVLKNLVGGFYMPCDTSKVEITNGRAEISFKLNRNPLIIYTAVILLSMTAIFAVLITLFMENGPLPHALSSYFFSVWSIRVLFGLTVDGFPTFFDLSILGLVLLIGLLLLLRGLGLRHALMPIGRKARNLVRVLEGRPLLVPPHGQW